MFHVEVDIMWVVMSGCVAAIFAICGYVLWLAVQDWRVAHPARRAARSVAHHTQIPYPF
jgi:hypothetical protein